MDPSTEMLPDRIAEIFKGKDILLTGGTGFLGKVLIEKLLRTCYDFRTMYLLIRPKKGKEPKQRLEEIFSSALFDKVRALRGGTAALTCKFRFIAGDVSSPGLGISDEDRKLICENVNFIYHSAATIRFDEELKKAVMLNTRGSQQMLLLGRECKKLELYVHVSTAYCHLHEKLLLEKPYPPPADPNKMISCVEWMDDEVVNSMTEKILDKLPNTYAFTKALSEGLAVDAMKDIPLIILRPSIIIPIWQEPLPGWTDNINGPVGLLIGAGKGVIRTMYCNSNEYADYLPVDIAVNGVLISSWNYVANKEVDKNIYNLTSSAEIKVSWQEMIDVGRSIIINKVPLNGVAWYPGGSMKSSRFSHNLCVFFFHLLPALLVDTLLFLTGNKPVLMRVQRRINKGFEVFEYYANNQWDFKSDNIQECRSKLNAKETLIYKIDGNGLDIHKYFEECIKATRLYILKEPEDTLPAARRHMKVMYCVDKLTKIAFFALIFWLLSDYFELFYNYIFKNESSTIITPTKTVVSSIEI
ncbi:fatty acyl-CoA reductase 1-like [Arctopsyche grandis]|uniref:fatty acyl-CoA reductase 1-like n=1 Tax=Arctopsyche grandis TaxID=121162 RepID=UPI00406D67A3